VIQPVVASVNPQPILVITDPSAVCSPGTIDITAPGVTAGSDPGTLTYWLDMGATGTLVNPNAVSGGVYYIQLEDGNGCQSIEAVNATVDPLENASFNLIPACEGATAVINGVSGGTFALVSPLDGAAVDASNGTLTLATPGVVYQISYTTPGACANSSIETVIPNDCSPLPEIVIPTAFTPDNDNAHDLWIIENLDERYPNNRVSVYNRWGNLVFEHVSSEGQPYSANAWDGTNQSNGEKLPVASYFYVIEAGELEVEDMTGTVSIILK
jgi:gliding motility-associated-like protein